MYIARMIRIFLCTLDQFYLLFFGFVFDDLAGRCSSSQPSLTARVMIDCACLGIEPIKTTGTLCSIVCSVFSYYLTFKTNTTISMSKRLELPDGLLTFKFE